MALSGYEKNKARISAYQNIQPDPETSGVGLKQGVIDLLHLSATPVLMFGVPIKTVQVARIILGSRAYSFYGIAKRPILSYGVATGVRGAKVGMRLSKAYAKFMLLVGLYGINTNIALAREREYKRLGINLMGPPGSLFIYDNYMARNYDTVTAVAVADKESRVDLSLTSGSKTLGKKISYKPKPGVRCAPGYRKINGMCVKK